MPATRPTLSRRAVLKGGAGLVLAAHLPLGGAFAQAQKPPPIPTDPTAFLRIAPDNTVTVIVKHIEFGQGPITGLSTLVAEELDADWSQMRAEHAPSDLVLYVNFAFGIAQGTGGSTSMANSFIQMRKVGAIARSMLVQAAANAWQVPAGEIAVDKGVVRHAGSGRRATFGQLANAAAKLPVPKDAPLKKPADFKLIGKEGAVVRLDAASKSDGTARFAMDIREPGMLTAVVARPPRFGATLAGVDATEALKVNGVVAVRPVGSGVAVYAENTWAAIKGRAALRLEWDDSRAEKRGSEQIVEDFRALATKPGIVARKTGDAAAAFASASKTIEAEYVFPFLAHGAMEPLDGYIRWDGTTAVARLGSQIQTLDHQAIAAVLGLKARDVRVETMFAGGSFGRRAQFKAEFAVELALAAKAIGPGRSVKLVWTREDDIRGGYYRPVFVHRLRGAVDNGRITAWSNTVVGQSFAKGTPFESFMFDKQGVDRTMVEGAYNPPYALPAFQCDLHIADTGVPVLWWRSVGHTHTGYAVECFVDELLQVAGQDPVAGRLALMTGRPRAAGVLKAVAKLAGWNGPGPVAGRARGVAVVESFGTSVAQIAEVSRDRDNNFRVRKVWCAVDCGLPVNPDVIRAQMEGGIGYGLGHVLFAEVTIEAGRVVPGNFDTYRSLRIDEMPEVEVIIVPSTAPPTGVGESGVPPIGPAVANAMARLGVSRPKRLPLIRESA